MSSVSACLKWRSAPIWKYEDLQTSEIRLFIVRLLSRVTPMVIILSEGRTGVPAIFTSVKGGKLPRRVDVPNKMVSDLSLLTANPLWQNQECKNRRHDSSVQSANLASQSINQSMDQLNQSINQYLYLTQCQKVKNRKINTKAVSTVRALVLWICGPTSTGSIDTWQQNQYITQIYAHTVEYSTGTGK